MKNELVHTRIEKELHDELLKYCMMNNTTPSKVVRELLESFLLINTILKGGN